MFSNQVPSKLPKAHDEKVVKPTTQKGKGTSYQKRSQLVETVAGIIIVIALMGRQLLWA